MRNLRQLTKEECRAVFTYNEEEGALYWNEPGKGRRMGRAAGRVNPTIDGYKQIQITGEDGTKPQYYVHVLIWNYHHGLIEGDLFIDHIQGVRHGGTNHIENLRLVTAAQNSGSKPAVSKTGIINIIYRIENTRKPWSFEISNSKNRHAKGFPTLIEAILYRDQYMASKGYLPAIDRPREDLLFDYQTAKRIQNTANTNAYIVSTKAA